MKKRNFFTGKVLNVKEYLNSAEIFVLPTLNKGRKEGSPVALLEAMACGLNVIASKIPGIKDQLENYPDHIFDAGSIDELSKKMITYMSMKTDENILMGSSFILTSNILTKLNTRFKKQHPFIQTFYGRIKYYHACLQCRKIYFREFRKHTVSKSK